MIVLQILGALYAFALPGFLVVTQLDTDWSRELEIAVGLAVGVLAVPMICFCAAWVLGTNIQLPLVLGVATVLNVGAAGVLLWRRRRTDETTASDG